MKRMGVGAAIVLGARESRAQGEGRQGIDVGQMNRQGSPWESLVMPSNGCPDEEMPTTAMAGNHQSLESPLQGNLHGGFGGGSGETPFGRAPCSYLIVYSPVVGPQSHRRTRLLYSV
jgi:hypothetical protein